MYNKLNETTAKPVVWSAYTADVLWADSHIAKHMLAYHLNPEIEAASRSFDFIDESVNWLVSTFDLGQSSKTIDFGCGPGLYTQRLKKQGIGTVIGLDFSQNSLAYATEQAKLSNLEIEYHLGNYLDYRDSRRFDMITMVMCDLCALSPTQRAVLLGKFKSMLAPNGVIALDVYTATRFEKQTESQTLAKNAMGGFWSAEDYWCIQSSFTYDDDLVTLDKYVISEAQREWTVYNWLQHFTLDMLKAELEPHGLEVKSTYSDLCGKPFAKSDEMAVIIGHK
ncbi:class I SAM-dependent methyltransferase [Photobacterium rosenbergii]|uniref:Class I SAM-dependent methyltransferase n=1 Tax=Photobacterium rosenbergii TaxID=294936 RepID=A0A2T3N232_9GAMM|nr:class I SAM-dependent methyltransferase [Photobacterium rosenbergii]PSW06372.1 class I SAM-dependent methyltransferase [Photobacterium rosenbergii]